MVRTYPVVPLHFDPARVAAWSAAIALHLLAFLLLLIPATYQAITALPRDQTTVRFIPREEPKPIEPLLRSMLTFTGWPLGSTSTRSSTVPCSWLRSAWTG